MGILTMRDDTQIYYKDWGAGPTVVFSHGWPLSGDAWESQMVFLASKGFRCIAHDRRGHGRSSQPAHGNDMDTYADDLSQLVEKLGLKDVTLVGHSAGGGEVARYIGRHGTTHVSRAVLVGAVTPLMVKTTANPNGIPMATFDAIRAGVTADRSQFYKELTTTFFGANRPNSQVSEGTRTAFWLRCMKGGLLNQLECVKAFSETDFSEDLKEFHVPTLIIHGDDDQIVPANLTARVVAAAIPRAKLTLYAGGSHGLADTHKETLNSDLLDFLQG